MSEADVPPSYSLTTEQPSEKQKEPHEVIVRQQNDKIDRDAENSRKSTCKCWPGLWPLIENVS